MASRKAFASKPKPNFIYPASAAAMISDSDSVFEFDESDIWSEGSPAASAIEQRKWIPAAARKAAATRSKPRTAAASSLPVNVPDWSKILKEEEAEVDAARRGWTTGGDSDEDLDFGGGDRIPPHEYLARTRGASLSVHEGIGRTLKGRDLRRVRNAIWKEVGFED